MTCRNDADCCTVEEPCTNSPGNECRYPRIEPPGPRPLTKKPRIFTTRMHLGALIGQTLLPFSSVQVPVTFRRWNSSTSNTAIGTILGLCAAHTGAQLSSTSSLVVSQVAKGSCATRPSYP